MTPHGEPDSAARGGNASLTNGRRILVTGGAGFVGSHFVDALVNAGHSVSVLDDLSRGSREWIPADATLYEVDIRDASGVRTAIADAKPQILAHLAALHYIPAVDDAPELAWSINVEGTRNVFAAAGAASLERVLFASTAAVYPNLEAPLGEEVEVAPIDLYGRTKVEGERLLHEMVDSSGASGVATRLFNVIGPHETNPHILPEIVDQLRAGATTLELGNVEPSRDFVDVRDVADALLRLVPSTSAGVSVYNVGTGRAVSVVDLVRECERILGRAIAIREVPERVRPIERMMLVADSRAIGEAVGWRPKYSLRTTLEELLAH